MDNVLDILYEYSINHRLLDRKAISKIIEIILRDINLNKKINYIISKDNRFDLTNLFNSNILGEFDMDSTIYIYYWQMLKCIRNNRHLTKFDHYYELSNKDMMFKKNILILEAIIHEIEHVKQLQSMKDVYDHSFITNLYRYEYNYLSPDYNFLGTSFVGCCIDIFKRELIYHRNYSISFLERMAKINSLEEIYRLLFQLGKDYSNLYNIQRYVINDYMIREYSEGLDGPTTRLISNIGITRDFSIQDYYSIITNMSLDDRIRYGFKITEEEYKKKIK